MRIMSSEVIFAFDYSKSKNLPIGQCISSPTFSLCGYDWVVEFYPQGLFPANRGSLSRDRHWSCASFHLILESEVKDITARYSFRICDKNGISFKYDRDDQIHTFVDDSRGAHTLIYREELNYLCCEEALLISCKIRVFTEPKFVEKYSSGLLEDLEKLWKNGEIFDVTFDVEGENISAHKFMLAARSTVFAAELFGSMAESQMKCIKINQMKAEVFKALCQFIYTDKLPTDKSSDYETPRVELLQDLFEAADRYNLVKLSQMCVEELEQNLSVDNVAKILMLADRHSCAGAGLKDTCLKFASAPEYFYLVAPTEGCLQLMQSSPTLFAELGEMVKKRSSCIAKTQKDCWFGAFIGVCWMERKKSGFGGIN